MDFANQPPPACLLVDNGSLQPESTLTLRRIADALGQRLGRQVDPVSLLHSNAMATANLGGKPAEILETAIRKRHAAGVRELLVLPLFFGPSGALDDFIPKLARRLTGELSDLRLTVGQPLAPNTAKTDPRIAGILTQHIRALIRAKALEHPAVIVVDHGSPRREVAAVRDQIARQVAGELADEVRIVFPASMERRPGPEYDFNDPLLEAALRSAKGLPAGDVVVALMFFAPGRHAGANGDIEQIGRAAEVAHPGRRVHLTPPVGGHPWLIDILADRYAQLIARESNR